MASGSGFGNGLRAVCSDLAVVLDEDFCVHNEMPIRLSCVFTAA